MSLNIDKKDYDKVLSEISDSQGRILQTLVPTIISVGLISIADRENVALITLITSFSVLFGSSLYVASLSYKIFRNACFIRAVTEQSMVTDTIHWEKALSLFNAMESPPKIIGFETKTVSIIYFVFSIAFTFMFYEMNALLSIIFGIILSLVAIRIYLIPRAADAYYAKWTNILTNYQANHD